MKFFTYLCKYVYHLAACKINACGMFWGVLNIISFFLSFVFLSFFLILLFNFFYFLFIVYKKTNLAYIIELGNLW